LYFIPIIREKILKYIPIVRAEPVERLVKLHDVTCKEDITAHSEVVEMLDHKPGAEKRTGQQASGDDEILRKVQHGHAGHGEPFGCLELVLILSRSIKFPPN